MPDSKAQVRLAHAVMEGGAKSGARMTPKVAREIIAAQHGHSMKSLPERVRHVWAKGKGKGKGNK